MKSAYICLSLSLAILVVAAPTPQIATEGATCISELICSSLTGSVVINVTPEEIRGNCDIVNDGEN
ncbi:uncharacterized protein N7529_001814 [Penicillium soppii]|uniref:uncharacterized protein n=1 Tax=Penicillium soppii TaxID=69789 RepID=UPI0025472920|nr:uncharacterized protein N7529_001814 [Penicillium soppii]KAJ5876230.1 hypothetical protein N7529_001814 [Penicillium soppii]